MPAIHGRRWIFLVLVIVALGATRATAQFNDILGGQGLAPGGDAEGAAGGPESLVSVFAHFTGPAPGRGAMLSVTAHITPPYAPLPGLIP